MAVPVLPCTAHGAAGSCTSEGRITWDEPPEPASLRPDDASGRACTTEAIALLDSTNIDECAGSASASGATFAIATIRPALWLLVYTPPKALNLTILPYARRPRGDAPEGSETARPGSLVLPRLPETQASREAANRPHNVMAQ